MKFLRFSPVSSPAAAHFALFAFSLIYYLTFFNHGLEVDDEGYLLLGAAEVLRGKWPLADFTSYGPMSYWLLAWLFRVAGQGVMPERLMLMAFLLANGQAVLWLARRFIPLRWALAFAGLYAFAPGPWYKLFFISSLLYMTVAALFYLDRTGWKRAMLLGFSAGIGFLFRKEAGFIGLPLMFGVFTLPLLRQWLDERRTGLAVVTIHAACGLAGAAIPVAATAAAYAAAGKIEPLVSYFSRFMFGPGTRETLAKMGVLTPFNPALALFEAEQAFYAGGLLSIAFFIIVPLRDFFLNPALREEAMKRMTFGAMALASMAYSFPFVWGSRMLSTFPLVYVCYGAALLAAAAKTGKENHRKIVLAAGCAAILLPVAFFTKDQIYSGSITTRFAPTVEIEHPLLRGIYPYEANREDFEDLIKEMAKAPSGATLVSMSESTTMGFLSGLSNPTVYRAFSLEFSRPGEEDRAIKEFERLKITYFVGRRRQFLDGGGPASNLDSYAPAIKTYLLANYDIVPLGRNFVLLRRKEKGAAL